MPAASLLAKLPRRARPGPPVRVHPPGSLLTRENGSLVQGSARTARIWNAPEEGGREGGHRGSTALEVLLSSEPPSSWAAGWP